jgi:predicted NBD/HSP70 family sugar kinase
MTAARAWHAGIDIGGSRVRLVTDYWGAGPDRRRVEYADIPNGYEELVKLTGELMVRATAGGDSFAATGNEAVLTRPAETPASVACGLPGTSDGSRTKFMPPLPWLDDKPLGADMADVLGAPVTLANDGHLTLLGEANEGAAVGRDSAVLVAVGTGIGGALMLGGKIWHGHHGSGGAWGWLPHSGRVDDPRHGQFEQAASGRALDHAAATLAGDPDGDSVARQGRDLVLAARQGDPSAIAAVHTYAAALGRGVAAIASALDPEIVLIGGGLSAVMDLLGPVIAQTMAEAASPDGRHIPVRAAALGPEGGAIGAWHAARGGTEIWL